MTPKFHTHHVAIPAEMAGKRLDQALALLLPEYSRSRLKDWIESGQVRVNQRTLRPRDLLIGGEQVTVEAEITPEVTLEAQDIGLEIVYQDDWLLVINKPAGMVVHPGAGNRDRTLLNALLHHDRQLATLPRAGIVHRLDKDTSGLLLVARTLESLTALTRQMQARAIKRQYEAVCTGVMTGGGSIDKPIGRHRTDRVRMTVREDGREALTHYRVIERFRAHTHIRVELETGRTHQIRVHLTHIKHPIVGDTVYGGRLLLPRGATPKLVAALRAFPRQALHAARLELAHPEDGRSVHWQAPLPADMRELIAVLRKDARAMESA